MSGEISARENDNTIIVSTGPDVCLTPVGSSMVPVAYTSVSAAGDSERVSPSVLDNENPDFHLNSRMCTSTGHEPGVGAGLVVPGYQGEALACTASPTVFTDSWASVRHRDPAMINRPDAGAVEPQMPPTSYYDQIVARIEGRGTQTPEICYAEDVELNMPARDLEPGTNESVVDANGAAIVVTDPEAEPEYDWMQQPGEGDREYLERVVEEATGGPRPRPETIDGAIGDVESAMTAIQTNPNYLAWDQMIPTDLYNNPGAFPGVEPDVLTNRFAVPGDPGATLGLMPLHPNGTQTFVAADGLAYHAPSSVLDRRNPGAAHVGVRGELATLGDRYRRWREMAGDPVPDPEWTPEDLVDAADAAKRQAQRMSGHGMAITGNQDGPFVLPIGDGW